MDFDVIIIGGGPAGLTAGLYAARGGLNTLLLERAMPGGQAASTEMIENYPGFPEGISGIELAMKFTEQAQRFGMVMKTEEVLEVNLDGKIKTIKTSGGEYKGKTVILATGAQARKIGVKGELEFAGRGVSYCATCDGAFFKDLHVVVLGGGDSAVEEALFLTKFASKVTLIHRRDALRATKVLQDRAFNNEKMNFIWNSAIEKIEGDTKVKEVVVKNLVNGEISNIDCDGVFVYIGMSPNTQYLVGKINFSADGYIETNNLLETEFEGVYAAGDVRKKTLRQVATAVADGAIAAMQAEKYISESF